MSSLVEAYKNKNRLEAARLQAVHLRARQEKESSLSEIGNDGINADNHSYNLAAARRGVRQNVKSTLKDAKKISGSRAVTSLLKEINIIFDFPFVAAFGAAILKDALDLADFETVILPMIFSVLCSIFIFMMLLLVGGVGKRKTASRFIQKGLTILAGGIVDGIPGLDLLPIETMTVLLIYLMTLKERAESREMEKMEARMMQEASAA